MPRGVYNRKKAKAKRGKRGPNRTVLYFNASTGGLYTKDEIDEAMNLGDFCAGDEFYLCIGKVEIKQGPVQLKALPFKAT